MPTLSCADSVHVLSGQTGPVGAPIPGAQEAAFSLEPGALGCICDLPQAGYGLSLSKTHDFLTVKSGRNARPHWLLNLGGRK